MLGVGANLIKSAYSRGLAYVRDGLKLYMPYRGSQHSEVKFVGTGSTYFTTNDYIDCGDITEMNNASALAICGWMKPDMTASTDMVFSKDGLDADNRILFYVDAANDRLYAEFEDGGTGQYGQYNSFTEATYQYKWTHFAIVFDGSGAANADRLKLYLNGVYTAWSSFAGTISATTTDASGESFFIGKSDSFYEGSLKNVAIWERALTATEIQNVMYKTYDEVGGRLASGLVSWWALDVDYTDSKGSNDGTNSGSVLNSDLYGGDTPVKPRAIDNAPTVQADAIGAGSASFGVVADIITTGFNAADELTNANTSFSILFWAIGGQNGSAATYLVGDGTTSPGRFYARIESDNTDLRMGIGGLADTVTTSNPYDSNKWNHCAFIYDTSGNTGKIYVDGVQEASVAISDADAYPDQNVVLGWNNSGNSFIGKMSQLGIWDAALTQAQIQSVMEKTYDELTVLERADLVSYWPLDVNGTDSHGSNDGTLA